MEKLRGFLITAIIVGFVSLILVIGGHIVENVNLKKQGETVSEKDLVIIKVTSYERTTKEQAKIMLEDLKEGKNLYAIYKNDKIINEIIIASRRKDALHKVESIILKYQSKGFSVSRHLCGQAIDLSKGGKNVKKLLAFFSKVGKVIVIDERDHYHIQTVANCPTITKK